METADNILDTSHIQFNGDFHQQVQEVMHYVRLQRYEVEQLRELFIDLYNVLSIVWRDIRVQGFGSIVTGLGMKTSDVDCFVELPSWLYSSEKSLVFKAKNVLMEHQYIFQNAFAISNAKVPIVTVYHIPTKMNCDINFSSAAGVENSRLIACLLKSDRRALELAILIKYWSKVHGLAGKNLMSSYCLTMLVIFFLQQCSILQAIVELQANVLEYYIDHWNTAFAQPSKNNTNNKTLYELLGDFFKYYKTFEYDKYMISTYLGRPIKRELFAAIETVPQEFSLYRINVGTEMFKPIRLDGVMCVQDPFDHSRNCAVSVYPKLAQKLLAQIQAAVACFESVREKEFLGKLLYVSPPANPVAGKQHANARQKPLPHHRIRKPNKRSTNFKPYKQNVRWNHFRGRGQRAWRQT